jgi:hypothetical protein
MAKIVKSFSLILLLPILLLNFPSSVTTPCHKSAQIQRMACCDVAVSPCAKPLPAISKANCGCQISAHSQVETPIIGFGETTKLTPKEIQKCLTQLVLAINFDNPQTLVDTVLFYVYQQPKFLLNLKIYTFVSSYLI